MADNISGLGLAKVDGSYTATNTEVDKTARRGSTDLGKDASDAESGSDESEQ